MMEMDEPPGANWTSVISLQRELAAWLCDRALPLWAEHGIDRRAGGYFEDIAFIEAQRTFDPGGELRRGRVVARQIYVFDVGRRLGWTTPLSDPLQHGCDYLFSRLYGGDGVFHTAVDAATHRPLASFNLYEQAFYLFALARLSAMSATSRDRYPIAAAASACLRRLRAERGRSLGGFEESTPPSLPLKSNPHMHLLEAALEWTNAASGEMQRSWIDLARELVGLFLTALQDHSTGAVREYFDFQWRPLPGNDGRVLEPGHQFEWAWLLMQWCDSPHSTRAEQAACTDAARRLIHIGETWGVDHVRGVAINEIWDDMSAKDTAAKLWPQTERVKAWCAVLDRARSAGEVAHACHKIVIAVRGLAKYLRTDAPGLWHESYSADGTFAPGRCKASSFYHVVCAIDVLRKTASRHHASVLYSPNVSE
ncbi:MAG: mannose-6-phosphate isomerase [Gammaproteobacteria bacterium]|nr:mannose-6-phosphate isomerase [Gammaproteobacteria bacterium]